MYMYDYILLRTRKVSNTSSRAKQNFMFSSFFCRKCCHLWNCVEKYGTARQTTDNLIRSTHFACWILKPHTRAHKICNTDWFATAKTVSSTRLNITLHVIACLVLVLKELNTSSITETKHYLVTENVGTKEVHSPNSVESLLNSFVSFT